VSGKKGTPHPWLRKRPYEGCFNSFVYLVTKFKGHQVTLTYEDFLEIVNSGRCFYCGKELKWAMYNARDGGIPRPWQIDRVDNSREYTKDNCVACCKQCNVAKHTTTLEDFLSWVERLYKNLREKELVS
jgi:hypothetical protein